jgi:hypothetical protein
MAVELLSAMQAPTLVVEVGPFPGEIVVPKKV